MEGELINFMVVWITVLVSLCYCHTIGKFIPKGTTRLFSILPIVSLFLYLPLKLTTIHLGSLTSFFIAWLANFKLLLFAYGAGPLSSYPPLPLPRFILISCLPIKIQKQPTSKTQPLKSNLNYALKIIVLALILKLYTYGDYIINVNPSFMQFIYCVHIYIMLELVLAIVAALTRAMFGLELEAQFNEPYLSTSLQELWGRRWNLIASSILRSGVYDPVRAISSRVIGRQWSFVPATLATFLVSGLMHELIFFYVGRMKPSWEITCFFVIHGACLAVEILVKKALEGKFRLHPVVSAPLAVGFVAATGIWLFMPPVLRSNVVDKVGQESVIVLEFVKSVGGVVTLSTTVSG